jgi:hypothetical protein
MQCVIYPKLYPYKKLVDISNLLVALEVQVSGILKYFKTNQTKRLT